MNLLAEIPVSENADCFPCQPALVGRGRAPHVGTAARSREAERCVGSPASSQQCLSKDAVISSQNLASVPAPRLSLVRFPCTACHSRNEADLNCSGAARISRPQ